MDTVQPGELSKFKTKDMFVHNVLLEVGYPPVIQEGDMRVRCSHCTLIVIIYFYTVRIMTVL